MNYPTATEPELIGTYPAAVKAGGGYVWDEVLEYRVWCHPHEGAPDEENGDDYYYVFANFEEAYEYFRTNPGTEEPLALVLQREYIDEPEPQKYIHVKEERLTEWPVEFLQRPKRTERTIPDFLSPDAPTNKLEILRGTA
jgi:putative acetyltransferase